MDLNARFALIEDEYSAALAAPLSGRKARLVAVLLDNFADRVFEALRFTMPAKVFAAEDVLAFREQIGRESPAMRLVFALCAFAPDGPRLVTHAVEVPLAEYPTLRVEDFMVSLYNAHTVQRVLIVEGGRDWLAHEVFAEAIAWWRGFLG